MNSKSSRANQTIAKKRPLFNADIIPPGTRIILSDLKLNVPVKNVSDKNLFTQDWNGLERYSGGPPRWRSALPRYSHTQSIRNVAFTGHSSYYPWNPGRYKDVFAVLHNVVLGDEIIVFHKQKIRLSSNAIEKIYPEEVQVLGDAGDDRLTLITCTPIGTNIKG